MGTIIPRKRKDGSTAFLAQISINRDGKRAHTESKTFEKRASAAAWLKHREAELQEPNAVLGQVKRRNSDRTLADAIDLYEQDSRKELGRTKAQVLGAIKKYEIAGMLCEDIKSADILDFARELSVGRKPQTVANYLSHLSSIFAIAKPAWGVNLDYQEMQNALTVAKRLGFTSKSDKRDRRPTLDELDKILSHYEASLRRGYSKTPMHKITIFALFSTRRQEEIVRLKWADLDEEGGRILVRDMKDPEQKIGNDIWCDLPAEAMRIIKSMPRKKAEIFPFHPDTVSASFTRACQFLQIDDLHFHDLRHEGVSRLFELGLSIPHVAAVSGHRSWASLKRYTHIRQIGDKYKGWAWLDRVAPAVNDPKVAALEASAD